MSKPSQKKIDCASEPAEAPRQIGGPPSSKSPLAFYSGSRVIVSDHHLLGVIGRGSYGEVWLARNLTGSLFAIKIIYRSRFNDDRPFEREFEGIQHFEPISRSHPSQLAILHVGKNDAASCFYYVMELADNANVEQASTLSEQQRKTSTVPTEEKTATPVRPYQARTLRHELDCHGRLSIPDSIQIGLSLTTALAHLHQHGLVHRDIKPSNVIFVNCVPKLGDIGLVTEAGDTQSIVGTEGYIPPEGPGTPQADIFSLGKVLYEISIGLDRRRFPELPNELRTWPDRNALVELNEILLKACSKEPARRYQSAEDMHRDLELLRGGVSIKRQRTARRTVHLFKKGALVVLLLAAIVGATRFVSNSFRAAGYLPKISSNDDVNDLYNMGRHYYQKNTGPALRQAIGYFQRAVEKDPNFALGHATLASTYCWGLEDFDVDFAKARGHAQRALAIDDKLPEAHKVMGWVKYQVDWDWPGAEKEFRRALELAPHDPTVHEWYGVYLGGMGRLDEAIGELKEAEKLDGLSLSIRMLLGISYLNARKDDLAVKELGKVIDLETNAPSVAYLRLADLSEWRGDFRKAIEFRERWSRLAAREEPNAISERYEELRAAFAKEGPAGYWRKRLEWAKRDSDLYMLPGLYARLGDTNSAFAALQDEFELHSSVLAAGVMSDRALDNLRPEPRFARLLRDMKLR